MHNTCQLTSAIQVCSLVGEGSSHLIVYNGRGLLIDCHSGQMRRWIECRGLPLPDQILHTHVEPGTCREASQFPNATIRVHAELVELSADRQAHTRAAHTVWENPAEWGHTLGREKYGVAGCITAFPPETALTVAGTFREGDRLSWQDLTIEVIPLPGHGRHHVGFVLEQNCVQLAFFTGHLFRHPARLVNLYDLEQNYGGTSLSSLPALLRELAQRPVRVYFPSTGVPMEKGPDEARALADAIDAYQEALTWHSGSFTPASQPETTAVGRYLRRHEGIYQINNFGNCILLIDDRGRGLMFDPGPCDFESPSRIAEFHRDLDRFERECGLKTIDTTLITHIHGDHYDMVPELRKRYPGCRVGAWDLVARVMEAPWDYPYAALLPWYNLGIDHVAVDVVLDEDAPFDWHDIAIRAVHLPGHCYCHAAYLLTFNGLRLAITGDTIQSRGEAGGLGFIMSNHSVPDERSGIVKAYRTLLQEHVDLNLGGHGACASNCQAMYAESLRRIEHALPYLRRLVPDGDLQTACRRPNMPDLYPPEEETVLAV